MCSGTLLTVEKISPGAGLKLGTTRLVGQHLTYWANGVPRMGWSVMRWDGIFKFYGYSYNKGSTMVKTLEMN